MRPRPRLLLDIRRGWRIDVFAPREERINLSPARKAQKRRPFFGPVLACSMALIIVLLTHGSAFAPIGGGVRALTLEQEREQLEEQLEEYEEQIGEYQKTIIEYQKKGDTLQGEIDRLNSRIANINGKIDTITSSLNKLTGQIRTTSSKIDEVQGKIIRSKEVLIEVIQRMDRDEGRGLLDVLLENQNLSDFFVSVNDLLVVQDSLKDSLIELGQFREELITQKEILALEKSDVEALRLYQVQQKQEVASVKSEKDNLLSTTKGEEAAYQQLLAVTEKTAAEIRARIFRLLGGGEMSFEEAYKFASYAEKRTGVRAALILAVLDRESALGRNVGQCNYRTAMAPGPPDSSRDDITPFLQITKELGLDPDKTLVSCPIVADGAYGGAMGPAQFIPTTWIAYKTRIEAVTGSRPASPWNNLDAFVATGLYLKDSGAASNELAAAAKYYCGGNWQRYVCTNVYGAAVIEHAAQFEKDIGILEG
ncbi:MAG: lytic murein transglycosylase [Candidatus Colwellbacteria bacterium]|nr:lytic murein transglycosylase [Candidatus Colwellbacteria bacterium]